MALCLGFRSQKGLAALSRGYSIPVMSLSFDPPAAPAMLYFGHVMHARLIHPLHRFVYRVFCLLLDLDRLEEAGQLSRLFSINRCNLFSFCESDHGARGKMPLRAWVDEALGQAGMARATRVLMLCYPRVFGFVFNPLTVFFCYDEHNTLTALLYEVRNTFGEKHTYVAPILAGELSEAGVRQERDKKFYVSPFLDMPLTYRFRVRPPQDEVAVRIMEMSGIQPVLAATFHGIAKPLCGQSLLRGMIQMPFGALKVVLGIHWEALKLWVKGAKFFSRPKPPEPLSY